ncbi:hypothetical protein GLYMA_12G219200v4 [Glycine max]|uniref:Uncharacterized protein n=1 Tax=Glycine max TaxID=3847 RepID=A0A0R0HFF6_SOYBN|nr:hypothetical protein GYH30_034542 [Glycine max]KRH27170.1 hypothetical protein GLYMA_12G219200v4 [Glycine max]
MVIHSVLTQSTLFVLPIVLLGEQKDLKIMLVCWLAMTVIYQMKCHQKVAWDTYDVSVSPLRRAQFRNFCNWY